MPRDNFRREREFRDRSAAEFNQLYWKIVRKYPLPGKGADGCVEIEGNEFLKETSSKKTFHCTNCGQVIITTSEDRTKRARISCPNVKRHTSYIHLTLLAKEKPFNMKNNNWSSELRLIGERHYDQ